MTGVDDKLISLGVGLDSCIAGVHGVAMAPTSRLGDPQRINVSLPGNLHEALRKRAVDSDLSMAHLVRAAIKEFLAAGPVIIHFPSSTNGTLDAEAIAKQLRDGGKR